jgi:long-chain acyl-CoA synthetase
LQQLAVAGPRDRALLSLPLHHAYPFVVGMLTTLTLGTTWHADDRRDISFT